MLVKIATTALAVVVFLMVTVLAVGSIFLVLDKDKYDRH